VQDALEKQAGQLGIMLQLTEAMEMSDGERCYTLTGQLPGADSLMVNSCLTQALSWASNIGRENS
jgi:c-di-GMP-related signal transduction protein